MAGLVARLILRLVMKYSDHAIFDIQSRCIKFSLPKPLAIILKHLNYHDPLVLARAASGTICLFPQSVRR